MTEPKLLPLDDVRSRLAVVWLGGASVIIAILVMQSLLGHYEDKVQEAWGWVLPTLMPTLGMILTVLGYTALNPSILATVVRRDFFNLSVGLSAFYLVLIFLTIAIQPIVHAYGESAVRLMRLSNLWLGPMQGLVASALGVLFVTKERPSQAGAQEASPSGGG